MFVRQNVAAVQYRAARHPGLAEGAHDGEFVALPGPRSNRLEHLVEVPVAALLIAETRIVQQVRASDGPQRGFPHGRGGVDEVGVIVRAAGRAGIEVGRRQRGQPVARARGRDVAVVVPHHADAGQVDDCVLHGDLDPLALARLVALEQGGQDPHGAVHPGSGIADGRTGPQRRRIRGAGHAHRPARGLRDHVEALEAGIRPVRAEPLDLGVHQPRVDGGHRVVAQPKCGNRARPVILDQHVEMGNESLEQSYPPVTFQIEGDALLAGVQQQKVGRIQAGLVRNQIAALIPAGWWFDLHDVGAQKGQNLGTRRPGLELRQIEDADMIERAHGFPLVSA